MAFEPVHNQIQTWAEKYPTVATRNSYSLGIADGLCRLAEEEKVTMENIAMETEQKSLAARIRAEDIQRQVELERIRNPPPSPSPEPEEENDMNIEMDAVEGADDASDNEVLPDFNEETPGENLDTTADFDTELMKFIKPDPEQPQPELDSSMFYQEPGIPSATKKSREDPATPSENEDIENRKEETTEWRSMRQLTVFRQNVKEIEESVIREKGLKLLKGRQGKRSIKDRDAFRQGRKDAKDINIRAPRIEEG